jgi:hypothetical protein
MADQAGTTTQAAGTQAGSTAAAGTDATTTQAAGTAQGATATDKATGTTQQADTKASAQADGKAATTAQTSTDAELKIVLPEGVKADVETLDAFKAAAKGLKLTNEQAQKLVDFNLAAAKKQQERAAQQWEQQKKAWEGELKSDPEFGGQNFASNMDFAQKAAKQFGGDALVKVLEDTGLGRHPVLVKALSAVGKAIADDRIDKGAQAGATHQPTMNETIVSLFPKSGQKMIDEHAGRASG